MAGGSIRGVIVPIQTLIRHGAIAGLSDAELLERYLATGEDAAFEAIVARHGRLVLKICGALLENSSDTEDAFQAVFLVLAQRAGSIRGQSAAPWLCRVSRRVACEANRRNRARARREALAIRSRSSHLEDERPNDDVRVLLEAIDRLPEKYRAAVVLCELMEKSHEEAGNELGVASSAISARVSRARRMLRSRLLREGVAPALASSIRIIRDATPGVPSEWSRVAAQSARRLLLGWAERPGGSATAASLSKHILASLVLGRLKTAGAIVFAVGLAAAAGMTAIRTLQANTFSSSQDMEKPTSKVSAAVASSDRYVFRGTVRGPDGKPRGGVRVLLAALEVLDTADPIQASVERRTDPAGQFRIELSRDEAETKYFITGRGRRVVLYAFEKGFGPAWARIEPTNFDVAIDLSLARDDTPIEGRLIDLEGRAVAGAKVFVSHLLAPRAGLKAWLDEVKRNTTYGRHMTDSEAMERMPESFAPSTISDAAGTFRLTEIGADRVALTVVRHPHFGAEAAMIVSASKLPVDLKSYRAGAFVIPLTNSEPALSLSPGIEVEGIVTDAQTQKPLAGIEVRAAFGYAVQGMRTTTDRDGRYRLPGLSSTGMLPPQDRLSLTALPRESDPHFGRRQIIANLVPGSTRHLDFALAQGVWLEGSVVNMVTRKPVFAAVDYLVSPENPLAADVPVLDISTRANTLVKSTTYTGRDGGFRLRLLPGPGVVSARALRGSYLTPRKVSLGFKPDRKTATALAYEQIIRPAHAVSPVNMPAEAEPAPLVLELVLERPLAGRLLDSAGKPVAGALMFGADSRWAEKPLESEVYSVQEITPDRLTFLMFVSRERGLGACVRVAQGMEGPIDVRMAPTGTVKGRLVDSDGHPRPRVRFHLGYHPHPKLLTESIPHPPPDPETDAEGRFLVENIVAGVPVHFQLVGGSNGIVSVRFLAPTDSFEPTLKPGEAQDWGDIVVRPLKADP